MPLPDDAKYQTGYSEENMWFLAQSKELPEGSHKVITVSNTAKCCPFWESKLAENPPQPHLIDYHVIMLTLGEESLIWDPESNLGCPAPAQDYIDKTWSGVANMPESLGPRFRVITAEDYVKKLCSDRSHLVQPDGSRKLPLPPWPAIEPEGEAANLHRFINMDLAFEGEVHDLAGLRSLIAK